MAADAHVLLADENIPYSIVNTKRSLFKIPLEFKCFNILIADQGNACVLLLFW